MKAIILISVLFLMTMPLGYAKDKDIKPEELISIARKEIAKILKIPPDCKITVEPITCGYGKGRKVVFQMKVSDTVWIMSKYPEVFFLENKDKPIIRVWDATKADENMPNAQAIAQWFLQKNKDPERCIEIMALWLDANRNKGRIVNYAYGRYAWAHREAGKEDQWLSVLEKERKLVKAPESIYEIHKYMAYEYQKKSEPNKAIRQWKLAQEAMKAKSDSYMEARYALPFIQIAKIHMQEGNSDKTIENLETYLATSYGKKSPFEPINLLGEIFEKEGEFDKARKLYMTALSEDFGKDWRSPDYLKKCQIPIRKRVELLDLQEKLAALIEKLDASDGKVRMQAYSDIQALGKEVVPFLKRYRDNKNIEIRGSVRELIKKLE